MDWARLIRGTSSIANAVTCAAASARTVSSSVEGEQRPRVIAPGFSLPTTSGRSGRTCSRTSTQAPHGPRAADAGRVPGRDPGGARRLVRAVRGQGVRAGVALDGDGEPGAG